MAQALFFGQRRERKTRVTQPVLTGFAIVVLNARLCVPGGCANLGGHGKSRPAGSFMGREHELLGYLRGASEQRS